MALPTIAQTIYVLAGILVAAVVVVVWFLTKEKRELALPNETDYGVYWIPLPTGLERGRLTSARKTFERSLETAIANAASDKESELIQATREELLKQYLFAFKGSKKVIIFSNRNLIDEKLSYPTGEDERHLITPTGVIDKGEHEGFRLAYLQMPDPDKVGLKAPERKVLSAIGEAIKYIRNAALNTERIAEAVKEREFYKEEAELSHKLVAELRSKLSRMSRALGQKPLTGGEQPKARGAFRSRLQEFFYSGWRVVFAAAAGGLAYFVSTKTHLNVDPFIPLAVIGIVVFFVYPYVSERI